MNLASVLRELGVFEYLTVNVIRVSREIFYALLFGGVFGGNYTPIGSTANIIAVSVAEKERELRLVVVSG